MVTSQKATHDLLHFNWSGTCFDHERLRVHLVAESTVYMCAASPFASLVYFIACHSQLDPYHISSSSTNHWSKIRHMFSNLDVMLNVGPVDILYPSSKMFNLEVSACIVLLHLASIQYLLWGRKLLGTFWTFHRQFALRQLHKGEFVVWAIVAVGCIEQRKNEWMSLSINGYTAT